jgi:hemoglobin-like flavoprotein
MPWHAICDAGFTERGDAGVTPEQAHIVQSTWRAVLPVGDTFAELFYGRLFSVDPTLRKLFRDDLIEQGRNLTAMLSVAAANIGKPERISVALRQLGKRHAAYGVEAKDFRTVEDALLFALEHALIDVFTPEVKAAWQAAYALLTETMLEGITQRAPAVP